MTRMAPYRRPRGTLVDGVPLGYIIERDSKNRLDAIADRMGVSSAVFIEWMVDHVDLTEDGVPVRWTPAAKSTELDGTEVDTADPH